MWDSESGGRVLHCSSYIQCRRLTQYLIIIIFIRTRSTQEHIKKLTQTYHKNSARYRNRNKVHTLWGAYSRNNVSNLRSRQLTKIWKIRITFLIDKISNKDIIDDNSYSVRLLTYHCSKKELLSCTRHKLKSSNDQPYFGRYKITM